MFFGQGFNSPHLHQIKKPVFEEIQKRAFSFLYCQPLNHLHRFLVKSPFSKDEQCPWQDNYTYTQTLYCYQNSYCMGLQLRGKTREIRYLILVNSKLFVVINEGNDFQGIL